MSYFAGSLQGRICNLQCHILQAACYVIFCSLQCPILQAACSVLFCRQPVGCRMEFPFGSHWWPPTVAVGVAAGVAALSLLWWLLTRRPSGLPPGPGPALPLLGHLLLVDKDPREQFR